MISQMKAENLVIVMGYTIVLSVNFIHIMSWGAWRWLEDLIG